jgi:DNA helicase-2/ATP-dependent DNA helicase PcrA
MSRPLAPDSPGNDIVADEERLLANVSARGTTVTEDGAPLLDYDREMIDLRDQIAEAKPEDLAPLVEQMARLQGVAARRGRGRALPIDPMSPYFAHMRLKEKDRQRDVLIGKRGFIDRASNVSIVDWRNAPISQIYYRYEEGDDFDESDGANRFEGVVLVRRNVSIAQARLRRIGCPQGTFVRDARGIWHEAEGTAKPVLQGGQGQAARPPRPQPHQKGKHAPTAGPRAAARLGVDANHFRPDKHLPEIAALIDKEQFDLITQPSTGLVLIQGGAGSGKTTVALHRVSYLNFNDSRRFTPKKMLVVVPSVALARYVEGVLPALGTTGVPVVTVATWMQQQRKRFVPEAGSHYADDTPDAVAHVKKHPALLRALEAFVAAQAIDSERVIGALVEGDPAGALVLDKYRKLGRDALIVRLGKLIAWLGKPEQEQAIPVALRHRVDTEARRLRKRANDVVRDWEELLSDETALTAAFAGVTDVKPGELTATAKRTARQREATPEEEYAGVDSDRLQPIDGGALTGQGDETPGGKLDPEDDPLLLRLWQLKKGGLVDAEGHELRYEHLAIDEAQDLAAVEVKVLLEATTVERSVTIAGDVAQRLVFDNSFVDWRGLLADAGASAVEVRPLRLSYRSTAEVMRFARAVLGPLADPDEPLVAREGVPVVLHRYEEIGEAVAFLGDALRSLLSREPTASVALISRHPEQADLYYDALRRSEVPALRRVRRQEFAFAPGVDVTDITQVKGLEFDYVILVEATAANYPDATEARHLLHIGATRAAHQLWLVSTGEPSPLLPKELVASAL